MKIFGTVDSFAESGDPSLKLGRLVANFEFLRALLTYGSFDQYHIFCPSFDNLKLLQRRLEGTISDDGSLSRVVLSHHLNFPDALRETEFSAFHVGGWSWYMPRLAWLRAKYQARFPLTGIIHSLDTPEVMRDVRDLMRAPLAGCDSVICTSEPGRRAFRNYVEAARAGEPGLELPARLDLIPLAVGDEAFACRDRALARARLGLGPAGVMLLYVGRMSIFTKADLVPLLYAFRQLRAREQEPVYLVLAGGADATNVSNLQMAIQELNLADRVVVRPNIEDAEKFDLYAAADIFVSPIDNFQETFGIAVVEAMAAGLPVVVSDFDGYRDLVEEGITGYRIPTTWLPAPPRLSELKGILEPSLSSFYAAQSVALDGETLLQRLAALIGDAALRARMGEAARNRAGQRFHWRTIIAEYERLWAALKAATAGALPRGAFVDHADPNLPSMAAVFGHYPTAMLSDATSLALSLQGQAVVKGELLLPAVYEDASPLLPDGLAMWVLSSLSGRASTVAALAAEGQTAVGAQDDLLRFAIMWLAKHGLIRLTG